MSKSHKPSAPSTDPDVTSIPLAAEHVSVRKRKQVTGRVRIRTHVVEHAIPISAELFDETVEVTRVPVDRLVEQAPAVRTDGDVTIIPVLEEVIVTEKKLRLKEEIHVRRTVTSTTVNDHVTIRTQRAEIERTKASR